MKSLFLLLVICFSALAQESREFNQVLIKEVQKDIQSGNDFNFKKDKRPMRGPASISPTIEVEMPKTKVETKDKQLGADKW
jgi:hypothetical protein